MSKIALYELYQAALRAEPQELSSSNLNIHEFVRKISKKDFEPGNIDLRNLFHDIKKSTLKDFLHLVKDRIITMNLGFSKTQTLGYQYYESQKLLFAAEILNTLLFKRAALFVAEYLVKKSTKYYFLNITFQAYRIIYSIKTLMNDEKGEIHASNEFKKYLKYYEIEKSIEIEYNRIFRFYKQSNSFDHKIIEACTEAIEKFKKYENKIPSFYFHFYFFHINYVKALNEKRHEHVFNISQRALNWFENLEFNYVPGKLTFTYIQIVYLIQGREYDRGIKLLESAQTYISRKSPKWFKLKENELLLYFHKGDFANGVKIFFDSVNNKSFISITPYEKQRWLMYEAYVNLILETGATDYNDRRKRFSIQRFINDLPNFSKDKRAMNIPILIAQMLFFIVRHQYNHAIDRIEALDKYSSRYLRNDETFRSNCFIKMLLEIPKNSFNKIRVERSAQKYFDRLLNSDIELIDQPFEIEIIPYERLWALIMNHLRPDHHYTPKTPRTPQLS